MTVKDERLAFVTRASLGGNFSALCREYGISRKTGYKWLERDSLDDLSRRPKYSPSRTSANVEAAVLAVRRANPAWGARKIHTVLSGLDGLPSERTIGNILARNGCITPEASAKSRPYKRFERQGCNQLWQADFKGEFPMSDGNYCYPLNILDDCSRFCISISAHTGTKDVTVDAFQEAFETYGLPDAVLTDNGSQFAGFRGGIARLELLLMDLDIRPIHGRPMHPQTQGKVERFNQTLKAELLRHRKFADISEAKAELQSWREKYNTERPHEALDMQTPGSVYTPSKRKAPEKVKDWEYSGDYPTVKVNVKGYVRIPGLRTYLSETLAGKTVELRLAADGAVEVRYRNYRVCILDSRNGEMLNRSIRRL